MGHKQADNLAYPPRAMRADRAAAYLDISKSSFLRLVDEGELPPATKKHDMALWDRLELDAAFENWKSGGETPEATVVRAIRDMDARKRGPA